LCALGLMGLAIFPQGLFRADAHHFLQISPPMLCCTAILVVRLWERGGGPARVLVSVSARSGAAVLLALVLIVGWRVGEKGADDLTPWSTDFGEKYRGLSQTLAPASDAPVAVLTREIMGLTRPRDRLLVVPLEVGPQLHFFVRRPVAGLLHGYAEGVFDSPAWRQRNLMHVMQDWPAVVVAHESFLDARSRAAKRFAAFQPELSRYLRWRYTSVAFRALRWEFCD